MDWWLRSPGECFATATCVVGKGVIYSSGMNASFELGIRPVMWISKDKNKFDRWEPYEGMEYESDYPPVNPSIWNNAYMDVINTEVKQAEIEFGDDRLKTSSYCLYDIDGNGVPELLMCTGAYEAARLYNAYSYSLDKGAYYLGTLPGSHCNPIPYIENNTIVSYGDYMGVWSLEKDRWTDNGLETAESYVHLELEVAWDEYPDYKYLDSYEWSDYSGLDNWNGNPRPNECEGIVWEKFEY
ncbi:MAG: hypothetical protein HUJ56_12145 [Erysipelotrichaceae bacterium]|nr:hypothetical protein [Erysipelotrichaceae bacterium]